MSSWVAKHLLYLPVAGLQAGPILKHVRTLEQSQTATREQIQSHQLDAMRRLVAFAKDHVPFYRERLDSIEPREICTFEDVCKIPFLRKSDLQDHLQEMRAEADLGRLMPKTTGGSTGQPVTVYKTRDAWARELAATWRGYRWTGVDIGDLQARFWGVPYLSDAQIKAQITDIVCNRIRFSAFDFNEQDLERYYRILQRRRPKYFYGYVSMLQEFAAYMSKNGLSLSWPLQSVITTSEVLTAPIRRQLSEVFQAPVYDEYGCGELGTIAHECRHGSMHMSEENMLVEILDGDESCKPGVSGEIVVTELNNFGMPMLRYRTGDFGTISEDACACGVTLRSLSGIHGRAYDFIRGEAGRMFHGEAVMYIFEEIRQAGTGIRQFQFVQKSADEFLVRIAREPGFEQGTEDLIKRRVHDTIHRSADIHFEYVDSIKRSASGKMRLIVGLDDGDQG